MSDQNVLFEKLTQIAYPNINKFNPSSFDWLFDIEEAVPFLNWFSHSVQPSNLLTDSELKRFEALKKDGVTILEGKHLTQALANLPNYITNADLEMEIEELKTQKNHLINKKQKLNKILNNLNSKQKAVGCNFAELEELENCAEVNEEKVVEEIKFMDDVLNETMNSLQKTSEKVVNHLCQPKLLSLSKFDQFFNMEEEYTALLTKLANTQFDQDMGFMAQNSGLDMCAFVKTGDPNLGELLGLDEKTRTTQNWELNHLQNQLPIVEENRIANALEVASLQATIKAYRTIISNVSSGKFHTGSDMKLLTEQLEAKNSYYLKECLSLKNEMVDCIARSTKMRCSSVIVGDCALKLIRQEFFISKQKEFFAFLAQQWAREQIVLLAIKLEGRQLESMLSILNNITQQIQNENQQLDGRLVSLKETIDAEKTLRERNTIPSSDIFAHSLLSVLGPVNGTKSIISNYEDLPQAVSSLLKEAKETEMTYLLENQKQIGQKKILEKIAKSMEDLIFGGPLISITQSLSRCVPLEKEIFNVDSVREGVQSRLKPLYRDFKAKQLGIKNDHLAVLERRLWTLFYTDPNSMQRKTEALNAKANAF